VPFVEANKSESVENTNDSLGDMKLAPVPTKQQELSKKQKRRKNQKCRRVDNANESLTSTESNISREPATTTSTEADTSTEPVVKAATTLNFNRLKMKSRKSVDIVDGQRMASNDEYFLVCPKNKLSLLDSQGKEHWSIIRDFEVYDICWSTYSKQFLILSDKDLYSFDLTRKTPLMTEISQFSPDMDECTCYDNIFIVMSDYGGPVIEVWDMKMNWKLIQCYKQPMSRKEGQGICSIRFSSSGIYLGVTLTEPRIGKAYFQIRNWQDMKVLQTVELPFYEGFCNHYILAVPNDEFLVHKYSEREMFLFDSNGKCKQTIQYGKRICSKALLLNDKKCLAVQTSRPDELHFYDL
jgi:hypothetical protein